MNNEEMAGKIAEVEQRSKSNTHRIDRLEKQNEALQKIAVSVEKLAYAQERQSDDISEMKQSISKVRDDVDEMKEQPGKRWNKISEYVILTIIGIVIGYLFTQIGM